MKQLPSNDTSQNYWIPLIVAIAFAAGMWADMFVFHSNHLSEGEQKLASILNTIREQYVDDIDTDSLIERTLPHLLNNLDPHSAYIPAKDLRSVNDELEGSFSGVGVSFALINDTICVVEIISGGPAERVGLNAGDRIVTIDDENVAAKGITQQEVFNKLRGPKDTVVSLGIKRSGAKDLLHFDVTRGDIPVTSIDAAYMLSDSVGYIKVNKFSRNTYNEFITAMSRLRFAGAKKYVLDLRGNGGGFMETAILMANEFLPARRSIVETRGRDHKINSIVLSDGTGSFPDDEMVILLDEFSASSSEILSGALQDNDRALIVGRRSFGKGLVQQQLELPDSSALRLTIQRYYTPSGRSIQKDYKPGEIVGYESEILDRYNHGEAYNADSVKFNQDKIFYTSTGRIVYGGGGILPDVFVPSDTTGITGYYLNVANAGLLQRFSYEYCDLNRQLLSEAKNTRELLKMLPSDDALLQGFVTYAAGNGVPARWYYISISRNLLLSQLKALIARDILGVSAYYEVFNTTDTAVQEAVRQLNAGNAALPITNKETTDKKPASNRVSMIGTDKMHTKLPNLSERCIV